MNNIEFIDKNVCIVWKPKSMTPNEHLDLIKYQLNITTKASFAGRLDPMASGKMIYLFGDATKDSKKYMECNKTYEFYIVCGVSTDSMDCMGKIKNIDMNYDTDLKLQKLIYNINTGKYNKYLQTIPCYSAFRAKHKITNQKRPLWYWAQHNELDNIEYPEPKEINLINFKILDINKFNLDEYINTIINDMENVKQFDQQLINEIINQWKVTQSQHSTHFLHTIKCIATVNSGTYIRYLVDMIGKDVGIQTHAYDIKRTEIFN
jgi:tRNA U55 pseudouridine synthase TruB